jgi:UDP-N-acetylglucosamine kinase
MHEEVFGSLKEFVFSNVEPVSSPVAIIVGAQPGSGKTKLITASSGMLNNNCVAVNGDDYREWHPCYRKIIYCNDKKIAEYTEPDVRDWTSRLFSHSIDNS